ncbi:nucleoprotein [Orthonairovirus sp.]|uniref:Nucleoprotein n=1 Tax=Orthonairovirus sp. TaxID=2683623 RepID=A0A8K1J5I4_9VIRU|nr:nucleoprotein [Orthonairovirus sp.]
MENKIIASDLDSLQGWLSNNFQGSVLSTEFTNSESLMSSVPDLSKYLTEASRAGSDPEKDAVFSKALVDATRYAAPLKACAWTSSTTMVNKGISWFVMNKDNPEFASWNNDYTNLKSHPPTMEQLLNYQKCALKWRKETGYGILPETSILTNAVLTSFAVPSILLISVQDMIRDMIRRRGGPALNRRPANPEHVECCELIMGGNLSSIINPSWGELDKVNSKGQMLLTTGFANLMNKGGNEAVLQIDSVIKKFENWNLNQEVYDKEEGKKAVDVLKFAFGEAQKMGGGVAGYRSQIAQIDTAFSSYYWMWRAGVTPNSFSTLSDFLFELGQTPRGNTKIMKALSVTGLKWGKSLLNLFADSSFKQDRIHMHPGVLTAGRLTEMGVCFGVIPASHPEYAAKGSGFAKSILNIKTSGNNPAANVIVQLFDIQQRTKTLTDMDVVSSEHLLHQLLVSKRSPFQNAFQVGGNPTEVNIITAKMDEPHSGARPKQNQTELTFEGGDPIRNRQIEARKKDLSKLRAALGTSAQTKSVQGGVPTVESEQVFMTPTAVHPAEVQIQMQRTEASRASDQSVQYRRTEYNYAAPVAAAPPLLVPSQRQLSQYFMGPPPTPDSTNVSAEASGVQVLPASVVPQQPQNTSGSAGNQAQFFSFLGSGQPQRN